eukprot:GHUV01034759.1.p1 GENE.GHUV01034759.1~~GHUV01034759.1.p1  ORF type:complete len:484 (-),score=175.37 GHUV01034759.1:417-1868(-)
MPGVIGWGKHMLQLGVKHCAWNIVPHVLLAAVHSGAFSCLFCARAWLCSLPGQSAASPMSWCCFDVVAGYTDITLTGESITDEILANIAQVNGHHLASIKLLGASGVTDAGIVSLVSCAPGVKQFVLEDAGAGVTGTTFVPAILQACRQLETLHIEGAPSVSWSDLHTSWAWWPVVQEPRDLQQAQQQLPPVADGSGSSANHSSSSNAAAALQPGLGQDVDPSSTSADGTLQHSSYHRRHRRVSSNMSDALSGEESDDGSSVSAASDSTSISVPAAATAAVAAQLQQSSLQDSSSTAGASSRHAALQSTQQQQALEPLAQDAPQQQQQRRGTPCHTALRKLHVRFANVDNLMQLIERCPGITELHLDGPAYNIQIAAAACPNIKRLALLVGSPHELDAALFYLNSMSSLRGLELEIKGMMLSTEQLRVIGMLPLRELALDSHAYRQQPSMPRPQYSHLDNEGVKGLVDSICQRMRSGESRFAV